MKTDTKKLVLSGVFLALGLVLPFLTMQIPSIGNMLLPMHIPVLLCGFICGAPYGLIIGFVTPLLRSVLFGMPKLFPMASGMAFELASYGFFAGLFYAQGKPFSFPIRLPGGQKDVSRLYAVRIYTSLVFAMLAGRAVWAVAAKLFYTMAGMDFTFAVFLTGAFLNAVPGIILQLVLIPAILFALRKAGVQEKELGWEA